MKANITVILSLNALYPLTHFTIASCVGRILFNFVFTARPKQPRMSVDSLECLHLHNVQDSETTLEKRNLSWPSNFIFRLAKFA